MAKEIKEPLRHFSRFEFGANNFQSGWCDLKVYRNRDALVVLVTEPIDNAGNYANRGLSVVNGMEFIVTRLYQEYQIDPHFILEYLPTRHEAFEEGKFGETDEWGSGTEDISLVSLRYTNLGGRKFFNPVWIPIKRDTAEELLNTSFPEWTYIPPVLEED